VNSEQSPHQQNNFHSDEIDLFELIESIWKEKILIIIITVLVTSFAVAYALVAKPTYQATTVLYNPTVSAIQSYNFGRKEVGFSEYSISEIYNTFITNLNSQQLRTQFFEEIYLPSLTKEQQRAPRSTLFDSLSSAVSVKQSNPKENKDLYEVTVQQQDPVVAAKWANLYVQMAIALSKSEILENITSEVEARKASINLSIESALAKAQAMRQDEITQLKEALNIANAIGLENPSLPDGKATQEEANYVTYMRGSKALKSQIETLEKRKDDHAFVPGLQNLIAQLNLLNALPLNFDKAEVVKIDKTALTPDTPIKPKKRIIVMIGFVLGVMLGVFAALIRTAIRQRKQQRA